MKSCLPAFSLAIGLLVSGGALYQAHSTHAEACAKAQYGAYRAALAPAAPNATADLGFTPMDQFEKVYPPACQPVDEGANLFSAVIAGAIVAASYYLATALLRRALR